MAAERAYQEGDDDKGDDGQGEVGVGNPRDQNVYKATSRPKFILGYGESMKSMIHYGVFCQELDNSLYDSVSSILVVDIGLEGCTGLPKKHFLPLPPDVSLKEAQQQPPKANNTKERKKGKDEACTSEEKQTKTQLGRHRLTSSPP